MQVHRLSLIPITMLIGLAMSSIAQARELTVTGPNGRTSVVDTFNRQKTDDGFTLQRSVTLPSGRVYNQSVDFTQTGKGSYDRTATWTGPQGKQTTIQGVGTYQNGVLNGTRTVTYPNGQSRTYTIQSQP